MSLLASFAIQLNAEPMFAWEGVDGLRSEHHNEREEVHVNNVCTRREINDNNNGGGNQVLRVDDRRDRKAARDQDIDCRDQRSQPKRL